jgi:hypothetical protein
MHSGVYWLIFLWHVQACCGSDRVHSSVAIILKIRKENDATCLQMLRNSLTSPPMWLGALSSMTLPDVTRELLTSTPSLHQPTNH